MQIISVKKCKKRKLTLMCADSAVRIQSIFWVLKILRHWFREKEMYICRDVPLARIKSWTANGFIISDLKQFSQIRAKDTSVHGVQRFALIIDFPVA